MKGDMVMKLVHVFPNDGVSVEINDKGYTIVDSDGVRTQYDIYGRRKSMYYKFYELAEVGEYVDFRPVRKDYTVSLRNSGYWTDQELYLSKVNGWRVYKNSKEGVQIISENNVGELVISGESGFENLLSIAAGVTQEFASSRYVISGRSLGESVSDSLGSDCDYKNDVEYIKNNGLLLSNSSAYTLLASREVCVIDGIPCCFAYTVDSKGNIKRFLLKQEQFISSVRIGVRIIITLTPQIEVAKGIGTKECPYRLLI